MQYIYTLIASFMLIALATVSGIAQNVGIGTASPTEKLDLDGKFRVRGDTIFGSTNTAKQFNIISNGGIRLNLDFDNNGSENFGIRKNGNTSPLVFEVTEGGNVDASGNATFNGNLTLNGNGRTIFADDALDITGSSGIDVIIDDNDGGGSNSTTFDVKAGSAANPVFRVQKDGDARIFKDLRVDGLGGSGTKIIETDNNGNLAATGVDVDDVITDVSAGQGLIGSGTNNITLNVVAENGLTDFNDKVELGGTLTKSTSIDQAGNNMTFDLTGSGDFFINDNSSSEAAFTVENSGNVGIGEENPEHLLHVDGSAGFDDFLYHNGDNDTYIRYTTDRIRFHAGSPSDWIDIQDSDKEISINENGLIRDFRVEGGNDEHLLMVDGSSNRVGIGKASPSTKLDVTGSIQLSESLIGGANDKLNIYHNTNAQDSRAYVELFGNSDPNRVGEMLIAGTYVSLRSNSTNTSFGSEVMRISSAGNVGIGTTSPTNKLDIRGDIRSINDNGSAGFSNLILLSSDANQFEGGQIVLGYPEATGLTGQGDSSFIVDVYNTNHLNQEDYLRITNKDEDGNLNARLLTIRDDGAIAMGGKYNQNKAKVEIYGFQKENFPNGYGYLNSSGSGNIGTNSLNNKYSLYTEHRIAASEFNAFSDRRIKNITGPTNNRQDLQNLMKIGITDYTFIDTISRGNGNHKKVIAQELANIYPQAVSTTTDVVPDIYQRANMENGWVQLETDLKEGQQVRLITENQQSLYQVQEVKQSAFKVNCDHEGSIFVYGRQVDDFHTVDYQALTTLNISATQALYEKNQALRKKVDQLANELAKYRSGNKGKQKLGNAQLKQKLQSQQQQIHKLTQAVQALQNESGQMKAQH